MEKFTAGNLSENEDDPDVYETSSDEWSEGAETKKKGRGSSGRKAPARGRKSKTKAPVESSESEDDDDEDEEEEEEPKPKSKNGIKRAKVDESEVATPAKKKTSTGSSGGVGKTNSSDYVNGGFLILRKDAQAGQSKQPCLWRIDGKALLQKYEPFEESGVLHHRNTSIYTGWSTMDRELYYPVTVKVLQHQAQNMTVELNWEKLKELCAEDE